MKSDNAISVSCSIARKRELKSSSDPNKDFVSADWSGLGSYILSISSDEENALLYT